MEQKKTDVDRNIKRGAASALRSGPLPRERSITEYAKVVIFGQSKWDSEVTPQRSERPSARNMTTLVEGERASRNAVYR